MLCFRRQDQSIKMAGRHCSTEMETGEMNAFVIEGIVPTSWNPQTFKITYGLLGKLFKALDINSLPQYKIATLCANLTKK